MSCSKLPPLRQTRRLNTSSGWVTFLSSDSRCEYSGAQSIDDLWDRRVDSVEEVRDGMGGGSLKGMERLFKGTLDSPSPAAGEGDISREQVLAAAALRFLVFASLAQK